LKVGEGQRHPGRNPGSRPNRRRAEAVRLEQVVDRALSPLAVIGVAGRVDAQDPPARAQALWLVDGAGVTNAVAQSLRRAVTVALEQDGKTLGRDTALVVQPLRHREVVEGNDRDHAVLVAGVEDAAVVGELGAREFALGRFDARPLEAKPERVEPKACEHRDVFAVAVIEVTRVAGRFTGGRGLDVLPPPPIGVRVAAFGLVGRDRGAEEKAVGKPQRVTHPAESIPPDLSETSLVGLWAKPKVDKVPGWI